MTLLIGTAKVVTRSRSGWREYWLRHRDRLLTSASFHRWAARFPLTQAIARRRAAQVFDLVAGFVYSQVLLACVRLHLFDMLAEGPQSLEALAKRTGLDPAAADRLLTAAVSLRLVEHRQDSLFGLGVLGAPIVGNAGIAAMVEHHALLYADLADPVALLRGESRAPHLAAYWPYATSADPASTSAGQVAAYSDLMSASQPLVADEILDAVSLQGRACLLDVGGGQGTFLSAAARRYPSLRLMLFDLPAVVRRAEESFARAGLTQRAHLVGGSFFADPLPTGADVVTLVRVLHDQDDAGALAVLRAVFAALPFGGMLVVAEPMAATKGAEAMGDAYFGFYLLAMGRGRARSAERIEALLVEAGFDSLRRPATSLPLQVRLITAIKSSAETPTSKT